MSLLPYRGVMPILGAGAFVAPSATVIGDVVIGERSSIWFGATVRGDVHYIRIGAGSNIQDGTVVHVSKGTHPTNIGDQVLIGHACVIHGCTLLDGCFIGMDATILDGVVVESGAMVAAGALVTPGKVVRTGELWSGRPARLMRLLTAAEQANFAVTCRRYADLAREYLAAGIGDTGGTAPPTSP